MTARSRLVPSVVDGREKALIAPAHGATFRAAEHVETVRATLQFSYENVLTPGENGVFRPGELSFVPRERPVGVRTVEMRSVVDDDH
jgi:hypothetical protein